MTLNPTIQNRQYNGNAFWDYHYGWVMPARINEGPNPEVYYEELTHTRYVTSMVRDLHPLHPFG